MDIGQLKNPYSSKQESSNTSGTGLFKIGDYDEPKKTQNDKAEEPGLVEQAGKSIKNGVSSTVNNLGGNKSTDK